MGAGGGGGGVVGEPGSGVGQQGVTNLPPNVVLDSVAAVAYLALVYYSCA